MWKLLLNQQVVKVISRKAASPPHMDVQSYSPGCANVTPCNTCFLGPMRVHRFRNPNDISIGSAVLHSSPQCPYTLQGTASSPQNCPFPQGIWTPSNRPTWFLGPIQVLNPNSIGIGWALFARLTTVTDRPTDRPTRYSVCNNRQHQRT